MSDKTLRFRLGIFVLGTLILLAVLITLFGRFPNLFKSYDHYTIIFDDASGVSPGTPVRHSGVRIGEVEKVELDDATGKARVEIQVDRDHPLRKDDEAVLVRGLIGGDTSIDFVRRRPQKGPPDTAPLPPGSVLPGASAAEGGDVAQQAARLLPPARETLQEMQKVFTRIDKMIPLMEETLREFRDVAKAGREMVPTMRDAAAEVRDLAKTSRATLAELRKTSAEVEAAARSVGKAGARFDKLLAANEDKLTKAADQLNEFLKRANATFSPENQRNFAEALKRGNETFLRANEAMLNLQKATQPLAERGPSAMRNLDESMSKLNQILGDVQQLLHVAGRSDGTLQRLLTDPSLYNHLDEAACMLTRTLPRVDRILQDVETFADKIARHPEALGLGGVVRPATGLKEAPSGSYYHGPGH
jgi:phospholipid/cholesterol/gamma-HCH transport system substrate-binding protein